MSSDQRDETPIQALLAVMARLRDPERGCPWDRQQTWASLVPHTLEEAYEMAECAEAGDADCLRDELGDLLFQVVFYARIAEEQGRFDFDAVARAIADKLVRRHPHVFGDEQVDDAAAQTARWEDIKARERAGQAQHASQLDGVSRHLPALVRAQKLQRRAARVGFDWTGPAGVLAKLREEQDELEAACARGERAAMEAELGDLLFTCVNLARHLDLDAETALRRANRRFEQRFRAMESAAGGALERLTPGQRERLWERAKRDEADG